MKDWLLIKNFKDGEIFLKDNSSVKIFKVEPINFKLKSEGEQESILMSFKRFLKLCNFNIQIIVQTDCIDIDKYLEKLDLYDISEPYIMEMVEDYKKLIKNIVNKRNSIERRFYIIVPSNVSDEKVIKGLQDAINSIEICSKKEILYVLKRYFKKNFNMGREAKWV